MNGDRRQRRGAAVVRAMQRELWHQAMEAGLTEAGSIDLNGHVVVHGRLDLPMLAWVTEQALLREIYGLIEAEARTGLRDMAEAAA